MKKQKRCAFKIASHLSVVPAELYNGLRIPCVPIGLVAAHLLSDALLTAQFIKVLGIFSAAGNPLSKKMKAISNGIGGNQSGSNGTSPSEYRPYPSE
jgi:hypothetical protein